jgi:hypothetical protein
MIVTKQYIQIYSQISNTTGGYTCGDIYQRRKTRYTIRNRKPRGRPAWINDTTELGCYRFKKQPSPLLHTAGAPTYDSIANSWGLNSYRTSHTLQLYNTVVKHSRTVQFYSEVVQCSCTGEE